MAVTFDWAIKVLEESERYWNDVCFNESVRKDEGRVNENKQRVYSLRAAIKVLKEKQQNDNGNHTNRKQCSCEQHCDE